MRRSWRQAAARCKCDGDCTSSTALMRRSWRQSAARGNVVTVTASVIRTGADRTLELLERQVGRSLGEVETPVAVIDLDRLEANLNDLQSYVDAHGIALWPHTKTHKSPEIGRRQLAARRGRSDGCEDGRGAGLPGGRRTGDPRPLPAVRDRQVGAARRRRRVGRRADGRGRRRRAGRGPRGRVRAARTAGDAARRARRRPPPHGSADRRRRARARAGAVAASGRRGGRDQLLPGALPPGGRRDLRTRSWPSTTLLRETRDAFPAAGLRCDRISGGSTPTRYLTHETCVNELRSGTYALLDRNDGPRVDECALWVEVTVISDAVPGQIVIDAGSKTFTSD